MTFPGPKGMLARRKRHGVFPTPETRNPKPETPKKTEPPALKRPPSRLPTTPHHSIWCVPPPTHYGVWWRGMSRAAPPRGLGLLRPSQISRRDTPQWHLPGAHRVHTPPIVWPYPTAFVILLGHSARCTLSHTAQQMHSHTKCTQAARSLRVGSETVCVMSL